MAVEPKYMTVDLTAPDDAYLSLHDKAEYSIQHSYFAAGRSGEAAAARAEGDARRGRWERGWRQKAV